ncbi:MAG: pyridoxal phosphate-dependent aminotransferase [Ignavibacteria bacterium]|nr:pyridoxal phosphate-dependent aminotransferase [Ignavibacteria bacterium]MBI3766768.1 pyridoxal phosphate-dependent aminotransferase [Ignavibacteriales bacterium]
MKSLSLKVQQIEESQTLAFTQLARKMQSEGIDVVSLTAGEPDFPTPPHVKMAAIQAIDENFTHYTANQGIPALIKAIAEKFISENNLQFDTSQILVSCGAKHSIFNALQAVCNKGDEVVIQSPYWVSYPEMVKLVDAKPVFVNATAENNFKISATQLRRVINEKTKVFIFNSPSNPTGAVYTQGEIEELADVIRDTGIYVISDEIYEKVIYDGVKHFSMGSIKPIRDQVITVNGVSKAFAMTGWRIGYLGGAKPVVDAAAKVQSQVTSNATSIAQRAAAAALSAPTKDVDEMVTEFKRRRDFAVEQISKIPGIELKEPKGAFYLFPSLQSFVGKRWNGKMIRDDMDIAQFLLSEEHLAVVPGSPFGAKNHIRLSYACSMKTLQQAMERLKNACKKLHEAY